MNRLMHHYFRVARTALCAFGLLVLGALPARALVERLDDSASPRPMVTSPPMVSELGVPLSQYVPGKPAPTQGIVRFGRIEYKLATGRYIGKNARIYYVVPANIQGLRSPAGMRVKWRGSGGFADGIARPGDRVLVWVGMVRDAFMTEQLELTMHLELRELQLRQGENLAFESYFEIEVSP
ncbi:MAG TPA: hypothetical protein VGC24_07925 [Burkholderiaceae bacterium]